MVTIEYLFIHINTKQFAWIIRCMKQMFNFYSIRQSCTKVFQ